MKHSVARAVVEEMRRERLLWLPPLSGKRGFSSSRVEHLLNRLVRAMPDDETYLEVGTLEGRTLEAAANGNSTKRIVACDPCSKYGVKPDGIPQNVTFHEKPWQKVSLSGVGLAFYDGDHSQEATCEFLYNLSDLTRKAEIVVVLDDWDRESVRRAAGNAMESDGRWFLIAEMPEYGDGLTCAPNHFGYQFGVGVLGWRAE